jgi:hypothetical protein
MSGGLNLGAATATNTNLGAIYNPKANQWLPVRPPPGWTTIGDAQSVVLPSGQWMIADSQSKKQALFNANNLTWTPTGSQFAAGTNDESGWTLLPDGSVFTVLNNGGVGAQKAQRWIMGTSTLCPPATSGTFVGTWCSAGTVGQQLFDSTGSEMGPQVLLPNGTVLAIGATGNVSIYTPPPVTNPPSVQTGSWANTTILPSICGTNTPTPNTQCAANDAPGVLLPSGNVLLLAGPVGTGGGNAEFPNGSQFFEFDRFAGANPITWNQVTGLPAALATRLTNIPSFVGSLMVLPNGQVMFTDESSTMWFYTPSSTALPNPAWQPVITSFPPTIARNQTYNLTGRLFNGMSQANYYGDDFQNATNYPIVQLTMDAAPNHVYYGRTHDHSSMGVAQMTLPVATKFELWDCTPQHQIGGSACVSETGPATLRVIANGIASAPVHITIQ